MRSDMQRNRRRIIEAALHLLEKNPQGTSMTDIAERAEVSPATAYRHFPSIEHLVEAVVAHLVDDFRDHSLSADEEGEALIRRVMSHWVRLILDYGAILVRLRSRRGYIERLEAGDPTIVSASEAWKRPARELVGADLEEPHLTFALMLLNQLSDPRDIRDLSENAGLSADQISDTVVDTFQAALGPWLEQAAAM